MYNHKDEKCPKGSIKRSSYTRTLTNGKMIRVKEGCITDQGSNVFPSKEEAKKLFLQKEKLRQVAEKKTADLSPTKCPKTSIRRSAHIRTINNETHYVPASCIKDQGRQGKGLINAKGNPVIIIYPKETLGQYGYKNIINLSPRKRQHILTTAYNNTFNGNWLSLFRTLNYLALLNKKHEELHRRLIEDRDYVKSKYSNKQN
jgi:hypothetical protein